MTDSDTRAKAAEVGIALADAIDAALAEGMTEQEAIEVVRERIRYRTALVSAELYGKDKV